ncbi:recombinase family protein [Altererythrobacter aquaemixtae]|uniref:Recombinase family protein n=1 Tax=Pontixanthobacter aquaemixtae TaxID=1958940 RepID=A0A844ZQD3_9SPHN|nr:recombinase family protein [Pontixanthobacter aquaemixtae]
MKQLRCAIYTRKSTDEGLEKDFNSLDAQREACAAYILSQSSEGWVQLADHYDDGGYSGGSMDRPALQQLLGDVAAGRVDVVVVYKIDRLTRSLADFAKIVETFDAADCSFVSVTQSFNTTSSMGRLTLNVLLSFAQFEREVAAERIRDKIAASKKRGMWMGGPVPLGYEVRDRKLLVVPEEAATVRDIMQRYLKSDGVPSLVEELERDGVVSKRRQMRDGSVKGGTPFRRGALAHLLSNRIYLGLITHKGKAYEGEHDAIVDQELFDRVQAKLALNQGRARGTANASRTSILVGRVHDDHGRPMTPCHTQNHGKHYRYYASIPRDGSKHAAVRFPAPDLEGAVVKAIGSFLSDRNRLWLSFGELPDAGLLNAVAAAGRLASKLRSTEGTALKNKLAELDLRVTVGERSINAILNLACLTGTKIEGKAGSNTVEIDVPTTTRSHGHEKRLRLNPPARSNAAPNQALVDLLGRAFEARDTLLAMDDTDVAAMPIRQRRHLERTAKLSYLAPDIVIAILDGSQPAHLSARKLVRAASLPLDWAAQRGMLLAN